MYSKTELRKNLMPPEYQKAQSMPHEHLKQAVVTAQAYCIYDYCQIGTWVSSGSRAILLSRVDHAQRLLPDNFLKFLNKRYNDLYDLTMELVGPLRKHPRPPFTVTDNGMNSPLPAWRKFWKQTSVFNLENRKHPACPNFSDRKIITGGSWQIQAGMTAWQR